MPKISGIVFLNSSRAVRIETIVLRRVGVNWLLLNDRQIIVTQRWRRLRMASTTVVDRRLVVAIRAYNSDSSWRGIDVVFAIGTNAGDVQRRAIRATAST